MSEPRKGAAILKRKLRDGLVIVGSDAHYWPGKASTAHRAYVRFIKQFEPEIVIQNGDVIDAATISSYPPIGWEARPTLAQELDVGKERLGEIEKAASYGAETIWTLGNHDARFEKRLATVVPEYKGIKGIHLRDHFPNWTPAWAVNINDKVMVKHRFKGGTHAPYNNAVSSGMSMITAHLHSLNVTAITDYTGTRFAADSGTMADPKGGQFVGYTEANPLNWRSGFLMLTFMDGRLLWPEPVYVTGPGKVVFRGDQYEV